MTPPRGKHVEKRPQSNFPSETTLTHCLMASEVTAWLTALTSHGAGPNTKSPVISLSHCATRIPASVLAWVKQQWTIPSLQDCPLPLHSPFSSLADSTITSTSSTNLATYLNQPGQLEERGDVVGLGNLEAFDNAQNGWEVQLRCDPRQIGTAVLPVLHFCQRAGLVTVSPCRCVDVEHLLDLPRPVDHTDWKKRKGGGGVKTKM